MNYRNKYTADRPAPTDLRRTFDAAPIVRALAAIDRRIGAIEARRAKATADAAAAALPKLARTGPEIAAWRQREAAKIAAIQAANDRLWKPARDAATVMERHVEASTNVGALADGAAQRRQRMLDDNENLALSMVGGGAVRTPQGAFTAPKMSAVEFGIAAPQPPVQPSPVMRPAIDAAENARACYRARQAASDRILAGWRSRIDAHFAGRRSA